MAAQMSTKAARYTIRSRPEALLRRLLIHFPFWITSGSLLAAALAALAGVTDPHQATRNSEKAPTAGALPAPERAIVDRYCLGCHNGKNKSGNLALDLMASGDADAGKSLRQRTLERYEATQVADFPDLVVAAAGKRLDPDFDPPPI